MYWMLVLHATTVIALQNYVDAESVQESDCHEVKNPTKDGALKFQNPAYSTTVTFAIGELQKLRCPVDNFCNIEWYRNDTSDPYPWGLQGAAPELQQNGQYLVFKTPSCDVRGNYTCVAHNDTHSIERSITLKSKAPEDGLLNPSQEPSSSCVNHTSCLGDHVIIDCRFNIDTEFQPKIASGYWFFKSNYSIPWSEASNVKFLMSKNRTSIQYVTNSSHAVSKFDCQGKAQIFISQLQFQILNDDAYGYYQLQFQVRGDEKIIRLEVTPGECQPLKTENNDLATILIIMSLLLVLIVAVVVGKFLSLNVKIWFKDKFGDKEENDGKRYDVYISYNSDIREDRMFATRMLRDYLMNKLGYSVCVADIDIIPGTDLMEEISFALERSRRFVPIISPHFTASITASTELDIAMDRFSDSSSHIIPILFQDITEEQIAESKVLCHVIKSCIHWKDASQEKFFKELQLRMPRRRRQQRFHPENGLVLQEMMPDGFGKQIFGGDRGDAKNGVLREYDVLDNDYKIEPQRLR